MVMLSGHHTPPASALSHAGAGPRGVAASAQSHARQLVYEEEGDVGSGMAWRLQQQMAGHEAQLWQARQQQQVPQQQQQQQRGVAKGAVVRGGSDNKKLALQAQAASAKYKDETLDCENFMESAWRRPERAVVRAIPPCVAAVAVASQCRRCRASLRRCRQPRCSRLASLEVCCCVVSRDALCPSAVGVRGWVSQLRFLSSRAVFATSRCYVPVILRVLVWGTAAPPTPCPSSCAACDLRRRASHSRVGVTLARTAVRLPLSVVPCRHERTRAARSSCAASTACARRCSTCRPWGSLSRYTSAW